MLHLRVEYYNDILYIGIIYVNTYNNYIFISREKRAYILRDDWRKSSCRENGEDKEKRDKIKTRSKKMKAKIHTTYF